MQVLVQTCQTVYSQEGTVVCLLTLEYCCILGRDSIWLCHITGMLDTPHKNTRLVVIGISWSLKNFVVFLKVRLLGGFRAYRGTD